MKTVNGKCKLCSKYTQLRISHVIPNSFFKPFKQDNNGKVILVKDCAENHEKTQESGAKHMLCHDCEQHLSKEYEKYSIEFLRFKHGNIREENKFFRFVNVNNKCLVLFFTSILWRALVSDHDFYIPSKLPDNPTTRATIEQLRVATLNRVPLPMKDLSVSINYIVDDKFGFSDEQLKDFLIAPFKRDTNGRVVFDIVLNRFWIKLYLPGLLLKERERYSVIPNNKNVVYVNKAFLSDEPFLSRYMVNPA